MNNIKSIKFGAAISDYQHFGNKYSDLEPINSVLHEKYYEKDLELANKLGLEIFRTQIEWSKTEPKEGKINEEYLNFLKKYLKILNNYGIEVFLTLHHFTNPLWIHKYNGWLSHYVNKKFTDYVSLIIDELSEYVNYYLTINEPASYITMCYIRGMFPPFMKSKYYLSYKALLNLINLHKKSYEIIKERLGKKAKVGLPYNIYVGKGNPLYNNFLKYLDRKILELFNKNSDFIGINFYVENEIGINKFIPRINPVSFRNTLDNLYDKFNKPIIITENGISSIDDKIKVAYMVSHLEEILKSRAKINGYIWWNFLHGYEWFSGYDYDFSLISVNLNTMERKINRAGEIFSEIIENRSLPEISEEYKEMLKRFNNWPPTYYSNRQNLLINIKPNNYGNI